MFAASIVSLSQFVIETAYWLSILLPPLPGWALRSGAIEVSAYWSSTVTMSPTASRLRARIHSTRWPGIGQPHWSSTVTTSVCWVLTGLQSIAGETRSSQVTDTGMRSSAGTPRAGT